MSQSFTELQKIFLQKIESGEIEIPFNRNFWLSTGNNHIKQAILKNLSLKLQK